MSRQSLPQLCSLLTFSARGLNHYAELKLAPLPTPPLSLSLSHIHTKLCEPRCGITLQDWLLKLLDPMQSDNAEFLVKGTPFFFFPFPICPFLSPLTLKEPTCSDEITRQFNLTPDLRAPECTPCLSSFLILFLDEKKEE